VVSLFFKRCAFINAKNHSHQTVLYKAVLSDHTEIASLLLNTQATMGYENDSSHSLIYLAASGHAELVGMALFQQDKRRTTTPTQNISLHEATVCGHTELLSTLLKHGVGIETTDEQAWTALHKASIRLKTNVILELLKLGAKTEAIYNKKRVVSTFCCRISRSNRNYVGSWGSNRGNKQRRSHCSTLLCISRLYRRNLFITQEWVQY
jgi:ankyrin repeat protein